MPLASRNGTGEDRGEPGEPSLPAVSDSSVTVAYRTRFRQRRRRARRCGADAVTWYCYLLLGFFTFTLTIQGNVLPFLKAELGLSYGKASLHSSAIAAGMVLVGIFGDRIARRAGRGFAMRLGLAAVVMGLVLLAFAPAVAVSIAGCFLIGAIGALIPAIVFAVLSDVQGDYRNAAYSEFERRFLRLRHHGAAVDEPLPRPRLELADIGALRRRGRPDHSVRLPPRPDPGADRHAVVVLRQPAGGVLGLLVLPRHVGRDRVLRSPLGADLPRAGRRPVEYRGGRCLRRVLARHAHRANGGKRAGASVSG